jgi:hypothetical protein
MYVLTLFFLMKVHSWSLPPAMLNTASGDIPFVLALITLQGGCEKNDRKPLMEVPYLFHLFTDDMEL